MSKILFVEDKEMFRQGVVRNLNRLFPRVEITIAETVEQAGQLINKAAEDKDPFDVIILDFRLPRKDKGGMLVIDESLCALAAHTMPHALIIHLTSATDDPQVREHLRIVHNCAFDGSSCRPKCGGVSFAFTKDHLDEVYFVIKGFFHSQRIDVKLNRLIPTGEETRPGGRSARWPSRSDLAISVDIADVCADIASCWHELWPEKQQELRAIFNVREKDARVFVSQ